LGLITPGLADEGCADLRRLCVKALAFDKGDPKAPAGSERQAHNRAHYRKGCRDPRNFELWLKGKSFKVPVKILNDGTVSNDDRLGQVGDIMFVIEKESVKDDLLVVAGDNLFNFSLLPAFSVFKNSSSIINPLWESKSYKAARESGSVVLNEDSSFSEFMEKAAAPKSTLLSLGIYFFPQQKLSLIKQFIDEKNNADKMGYFLTWMMNKETVYGHVYFEKWFDIGWIEALEEARQKFGE
jgi:glucose-1-phosphate thymidylyltransferase